MSKICIFAGTSEGRRLIELLAGRGLNICACVATEYGEVLLGAHPDVQIHAGRMDEAQMEAMLRSEAFELVIDATHPYADRVTENIAAACTRANVEYLRLLRSSDSEDDDGIFVESAAACVEYLKNTEGSILLTTGSKNLSVYAPLHERIYARVLPMQASLDACAAIGIAPDRIIAMQGPFDEEMNLAILKMTRARYMVTKDTGGPGGYGAKIRAARRAAVRCIIIGRPPQREGMDMPSLLSLLGRRFSLLPSRRQVTLAGIGMGGADARTLAVNRAIAEADCLIGARRMLELAAVTGREQHIAVAAADIAACIRQSAARRPVVLLSGDTGFYSGAKALLAELGDDKSMDIAVLPGVGSLQYFCSRLQRPWEDVRTLSLHGRDCNFVGEVRRSPAVFALVGGRDGVKNALGRLCEAGLGHLRVHVGERLGYPEEKISHGSAADLMAQEWNSLSVLLVENAAANSFIVTHGLPDDAFDRDETPMTKSEVRSISLSRLELNQSAVVYDVGSGSGSVSVECALQAVQGRVYGIEMNGRAIALSRKNAAKFALSNLEIIPGKAPEAFEALEPPTHAFIGGSSGSMRGIIDGLLRKNPQVRIVVNTVTLETLAELTEISREFDFSDIVEVSITRPRPLGRYRLMTAQNPVFIFTLQNHGQNGSNKQNGISR